MCFNKIPCFVFSIFHAWLVDLSTHTQTHLTALFPGLPRWAGTRKVKPIWILLKHETVSGSGISWARCKSAPHSRQITMPAPHSCFFTGRMPFLPPNQQRQSTEGISRSIQLLSILSYTYSAKIVDRPLLLITLRASCTAGDWACQLCCIYVLHSKNHLQRQNACFTLLYCFFWYLNDTKKITQWHEKQQIISVHQAATNNYGKFLEKRKINQAVISFK